MALQYQFGQVELTRCTTGERSQESTSVNGRSDQGQSQANDRTTVSGESATRYGGEDFMPNATAATVLPPRGTVINDVERYVAAMTTSANSVIAAIDARRPGMTIDKLQLLLFFAQGHHLAWRGRPLFDEPMYATERGVAVEDVPGEDAPALHGEGPLNTVGYVVERYAALSPADLRTLIQASQPWQAATKPGGGPRIEWAHLRDWFRRPDETDDPDDERPNRAEMDEAMRFWRSLNS